MKKLTIIIAIVMLQVACVNSKKEVTFPNTVKEINTITVGNYYKADFWADCSGKTRVNVIVKSTIPITQQWTRDSIGGGYLHIIEKSTDTSYLYKSDGTQNPYCGY
jgi:hypothetical protein